MALTPARFVFMSRRSAGSLRTPHTYFELTHFAGADRHSTATEASGYRHGTARAPPEHRQAERVGKKIYTIALEVPRVRPRSGVFRAGGGVRPGGGARCLFAVVGWTAEMAGLAIL